MAELKYAEKINEAIDAAIFDGFKQTSEFATLKSNVLQGANTTIEQADAFLDDMVKQGVPIEHAITCIKGFIKLRTNGS